MSLARLPDACQVHCRIAEGAAGKGRGDTLATATFGRERSVRSSYRTAMELPATDVTVRVRVTPLDGKIYRVVRNGGRVSIVPAMGLGPGQHFVWSGG
jgi:hypothetical protein